MLVGIDLLWVRVGICGGSESYVRNLILGFKEYDEKNQYILFVAKDNADSFKQYMNDNIRICICNIDSKSQWKRILWENMFLDKKAMAEEIDIMYIPVYSKPRSNGKIAYITSILDLQAFHYPEYFTLPRRLFFKYSWWHSCKTSKYIFTISEFCREDIIKRYPFAKDKVKNLYLPIEAKNLFYDFTKLEKKYQIEKEKYFYCVSSMLPHKNLKTIINMMLLIHSKQEMKLTEYKLVISGVGDTMEAKSMIEKFGLSNQIIITGFVTDQERDCLYDNCKLFLFPSLFEGFGMPIIEALQRGKLTIMSKIPVLEEISKGNGVFVENPIEEEEWLTKVKDTINSRTKENVNFEDYQLKKIVEKYMQILVDE